MPWRPALLAVLATSWCSRIPPPQAVPRGHRISIFNCSPLFSRTSGRPSHHGCRQVSYLLLGQPSCWGSLHHLLPSQLQVDFPASCGSLLHYRSGFSKSFQTGGGHHQQRLTHSCRPYVKLSTPQCSGHMGVVTESSPTPTAGVAHCPAAR